MSVWQPEPSSVGVVIEGDRLVVTGRFRAAGAELVKSWCNAVGMDWRMTTRDTEVHLTFGRDGELDKAHAHFSAWFAARTFRNRYTEIGDGALCSLMVGGPDGETDYASILGDPAWLATA